MDINHVELNANLVAGLYRDTLVDLAEHPVEIPVASPPAESGPRRTDVPLTAWKFLGENKKNILVVTSHPGLPIMPDSELAFLTSILGACKLSLADVAIINQENRPEMPLKDILTHFSSKVVLLFDVEPDVFGLPMKFPHYQQQSFAGNDFLYAPSLENLEKDRVEKSKLWVCLKRLFNL